MKREEIEQRLNYINNMKITEGNIADINREVFNLQLSLENDVSQGMDNEFKTEVENKLSRIINYLNTVKCMFGLDYDQIEFSNIFNNDFSSISKLVKNDKWDNQVKDILNERKVKKEKEMQLRGAIEGIGNVNDDVLKSFNDISEGALFSDNEGVKNTLNELLSKIREDSNKLKVDDAIFENLSPKFQYEYSNVVSRLKLIEDKIAKELKVVVEVEECIKKINEILPLGKVKVNELSDLSNQLLEIVENTMWERKAKEYLTDVMKKIGLKIDFINNESDNKSENNKEEYNTSKFANDENNSEEGGYIQSFVEPINREENVNEESNGFKTFVKGIKSEKNIEESLASSLNNERDSFNQSFVENSNNKINVNGLINEALLENEKIVIDDISLSSLLSKNELESQIIRPLDELCKNEDIENGLTTIRKCDLCGDSEGVENVLKELLLDFVDKVNEKEKILIREVNKINKINKENLFVKIVDELDKEKLLNVQDGDYKICREAIDKCRIKAEAIGRELDAAIEVKRYIADIDRILPSGDFTIIRELIEHLEKIEVYNSAWDKSVRDYIKGVREHFKIYEPQLDLTPNFDISFSFSDKRNQNNTEQLDIDNNVVENSFKDKVLIVAENKSHNQRFSKVDKVGIDKVSPKFKEKIKLSSAMQFDAKQINKNAKNMKSNNKQNSKIVKEEISVVKGNKLQNQRFSKVDKVGIDKVSPNYKKRK